MLEISLGKLTILPEEALNELEPLYAALREHALRTNDLRGFLGANHLPVHALGTESSDEQSSGIELVNKAIVDMDRVTQQNAALVEEAAAGAASMQDEANRLTQAVAVFKLV